MSRKVLDVIWCDEKLGAWGSLMWTKGHSLKVLANLRRFPWPMHRVMLASHEGPLANKPIWLCPVVMTAEATKMKIKYGHTKREIY